MDKNKINTALALIMAMCSVHQGTEMAAYTGGWRMLKATPRLVKAEVERAFHYREMKIRKLFG